jgi:hypothetical protein
MSNPLRRVFICHKFPMSSHQSLSVQIAKLLKESLEADGHDVANFCEYFAQWKATGVDGEFSDWFFGKDGFYARPKRNNQFVLRHVHLPPEINEVERKQWYKKAERGALKVSDTALVYAQDSLHGYLLIYIIREPDAHVIANMSTPESKKLMENLCDVAEDFIFNGRVTI